MRKFYNIPLRHASNAQCMKGCFVIFVLALAPFLACAGGDEVVVVYNRDMPESKAVALYYARARHVPEKQIYGFSLPATEIMTREAFRSRLQIPLAEKLKSSGLWKFGKTSLMSANGIYVNAVRCVVASKIRYAVLCYGVPLKIANDPNINEPQSISTASLFQANNASVDSELAWLPLIQNDERLSGPMKNWLYGVTNAALLGPTNGILLVTRLDGPTEDIAMGLVQKSMQAEQDGLWGRAYFDARGITDSSYKLGDDWILGSAQLCRDLGFETTVDTNAATFPADFPMSQIAIYAGWYSGDADGPFAQPTVEFMPGAFAYHLHSYSAATIRSTTKNWCGPLLAKGATCTMGCVDEPSIQFTPNVMAFLARWTLSRLTFGEAAWAAQPALSWQTTVIGDPLYCPFAKDPSDLNVELSRDHNPLVQWSYLRAVNAAQVRGAQLSQLEDLLENLALTATSAILTEKLAELCDTQGKPDAAIEFYQEALKLKPSPEQRIRIRLILARDLLAQTNTTGAIQDYKALLQEAPDYPGTNSISDKIAALEQKISHAK
ncbi:MAG TPA: TIGR03790 family protein [Candidatus Acidoferrum sp.]|nr:TIGR03790 family protein [Candidatus Acidoferrum sp.]